MSLLKGLEGPFLLFGINLGAAELKRRPLYRGSVAAEDKVEIVVVDFGLVAMVTKTRACRARRLESVLRRFVVDSSLGRGSLLDRTSFLLTFINFDLA